MGMYHKRAIELINHAMERGGLTVTQTGKHGQDELNWIPMTDESRLRAVRTIAALEAACGQYADGSYLCRKTG